MKYNLRILSSLLIVPCSFIFAQPEYLSGSGKEETLQNWKKSLIRAISTSTINEKMLKALKEYIYLSSSSPSNGYTALHIACLSRNTAAFEILIALGLNPNTQDDAEQTPLHSATFQRDIQSARALLEFGADPNIRDGQGHTPLHLAVAYANPELIKTLLEFGADLNIQNNHGLSSLDIATLANNKAAIETLQSFTDERKIEKQESPDLQILVQQRRNNNTHYASVE